MNILGIINKDKTRIYLDKKKIDLKELFVYFKGDIFNKESLLKKYKLKIKNDEELIKYLYKHEKTSFLKKLDGDFLIVIYDKEPLNQSVAIFAKILSFLICNQVDIG